jgi:transposase
MAATAVVETGEAQVRLLVVAGCLAGERRPVEAGAAGAEKTFRPYDPDQILLLAPCLQDWVPGGHLARFVSDLVDEALDLSAIYASYEGERGYPPYEPRLMVKLLVYGYATGTPSSRRLEERTQTDVAVRFLCADQHPDFRSIARFRRRHLDALAELFVQALRLCQRAGLVKLGTLALDGTKLRANASRRKAMSYERMARAERRLELEIEAMRAQARGLLSEAEAADAVEDERFGRDRRGDELPAELARREQRLARIREAKAALEAEAVERERERVERAEREGKRPRRRVDDDPPQPKPAAQRNFTDPESKIMKTSDGSFHQCFNGQALVDSHAQVIVAAELSDEAPDARQLEPALAQLAQNLAAIDAELADNAALLADAGYYSEENVETAVAHRLDPHIATGRLKHSQPVPAAPRGRIPNDATPKQRMARKLRTKKGHAAYTKRKTIVEPVFGQMYTVQAARQLLLRGKHAARAQWRFNCAVHNLLKLHRGGGLTLLSTA